MFLSDPSVVDQKINIFKCFLKIILSTDIAEVENIRLEMSRKCSKPVSTNILFFYNTKVIRNFWDIPYNSKQDRLEYHTSSNRVRYNFLHAISKFWQYALSQDITLSPSVFFTLINKNVNKHKQTKFQETKLLHLIFLFFLSFSCDYNQKLYVLIFNV